MRTLQLQQLHIIQNRPLNRIQTSVNSHRLGIGALLHGDVGIFNAVAGQGADDGAAFGDFAGADVV